jgi:hypothetical protein
MNKTEFLATLTSERAQLDEQLARLSDEQLSKQPAPDAWSIKQNLAHLVYWEQVMLEKVRAAVEKGETPQWINEEEETRLNAEIAEASRDRPAGEILAEMRQSLRQVIAQVEALSEADLTDPNRFPWRQGQPLWEYIAAEAYGEHYHEHLKL